MGGSVAGWTRRDFPAIGQRDGAVITRRVAGRDGQQGTCMRLVLLGELVADDADNRGEKDENDGDGVLLGHEWGRSVSFMFVQICLALSAESRGDVVLPPFSPAVPTSPVGQLL